MLLGESSDLLVTINGHRWRLFDEASLVCVTSSFFFPAMNSLRSGRCECESLANCQQASCQHFNSVFTPAISCWKLGLSTAEHLVDNDKLCHNASQWATTLNTSPPTTTRPLVWGLEFSNFDINWHNIKRRHLLAHSCCYQAEFSENNWPLLEDCLCN